MKINAYRLVAARIARDLSQGALSRAVGISQGYLSRMEAGTFPGSGEVIARIAAVLEVPVTDIADDDGIIRPTKARTVAS